MSAVTSSYCSQYAQRLPQDMGQAAIGSFLFSFTAATLVSGGNIPFACVAGTLAAAASLIDSLMRPLIQDPVQRRPDDYSDVTRRTLLKAAIILTFTSLTGPIYGETISKALSIIWTFFGVTGCVTGWDSPIEYSRRAECYCIA